MNVQGKGQNQGKGKSKSNEKSQKKKEIVCWNCDKKGHLNRHYRAPKKKKNQNQDRQVATATEGTIEALVYSVDSPVESWILDSSMSFHSTPNKGALHNYVARKFGKMFLADDEPLDIVGKGDVHMSTSNGVQWKLQDVRHVPGLKRNMISMSQIDADGYTTTFGGGRWRITTGDLVIAKGNKSRKLYMTTAYLIDRGPSVPLGLKIPEEEWTRTKVNLSHLHIFGCESFVHVSSNERDKLDPEARRCFFVGYGGDNFGYRFWDMGTNTIITHRDVTFNEKVMYKDRDTTTSKSEVEKGERVILDDSSDGMDKNA